MRRGIKRNEDWRRLKNQAEQGDFIGGTLKTFAIERRPDCGRWITR
jgi:hypothetical protein